MKATRLVILVTLIISFSVNSCSDFKLKENQYTTHLTDSEVKNYEDWIEFKNSFVRSESILKELPKSFQPQSEEYFKGLLKFDLVFFILGGVVTFLFILYVILRVGFGKCVGPLSIKHINKGYKISTWILISGSLIAFCIVYGFIIIPSINLGINSKNAIDNAKSTVRQELDYMEPLIQLNKKLLEKEYKIDDHNFQIFNKTLNEEVNTSLDNHSYIAKLEIARNLLNIFLFVYFIILIALGLIFFYKNKQKSAFVISILILFTIPTIIFLEVINTNYFFIVSDLCDSINQALYNNKMPIYGVGLGWMTNCHSSEVRAKGYTYNYELYTIYEGIGAKIKAEESKEKSTVDVSELKSLRTEILKTKQDNLDVILSCDVSYRTIIDNERDVCKYGPQRSYTVFKNYFWLMIVSLFMFWGFNRNALVIKRRLYDLNEKLMAEETTY